MKRKTTLDCYNFTLIKRPKIVSKILNLPTDVMILIFKLLTPSERLNAINVCQQWLDLVNRYFSKDHCLVLSSDLDYSTTGSLYQTFSDRLTTTRDKRTFSHMEIESFPNNAEKLSLMGNFIELVGDEVTSLKIEDIPFYLVSDPTGNMLNVNVFSKLSKLENLELSSDLVFANLSSATNLKRIKVLGTFCDVKHIQNCRKIKSVETLTMTALEIATKELNDESLVSFLEPSIKTLMKHFIGRDPCDYITLEAPTFNFCGTTKMTLDDIHGIHSENSINLVPPEILREFKNLKRLKFCSWQDPERPIVLTKKRVTYSGITHLHLNGSESFPPPYFDKLLQSFPDLESLKMCGFGLRNEHLSTICEFMPKLTELELRGPCLELSVRMLIATDRYALKDLRFLERLEIETKYQSNDGQWPSLPNLKELNLYGSGFRSFTRDFYSQIAKKCPKLTEVTISYDLAQHSSYTKFLPLMSQLNLTHLVLPGVGERYDMEVANAALVTNLIEFCQDLKEVTIKDEIGFSLSQEFELFSNIASLEEVTSITMSNGELDKYRVMKRKDAENIKGYLGKNLQLYKNLRETVDYVVESVIPPNDFRIMNQSYQRNYANDDEDADELANFYMVTHDFLEMNHFSMCKLLNKLVEASDV